MVETAPLFGLLLAGGKSRRMGADKANLVYGETGLPEWKRMAGLLAGVCERVFVSIRQGQILNIRAPDDPYTFLPDPPESKGPLTGLLTAAEDHPEVAWLMVACDLPLLDAPILQHLLTHRGKAEAIAYHSAHDGLPEPMCAIYEPAMIPRFLKAFHEDIRCPRKILINHPASVRLIDLPDPRALDNANTPDEYNRIDGLLKESRL